MPTLISLKIDGLDDFKNDIVKGVQAIQPEINKAMVKAVNLVKNDAQQKAPFKTGTLRRSIFTQVRNNGLQGIVSQDSDMASYGIHVEFGTKAHEILPVNKKALFWKGALNPYKRVMHPGTAAHPYMVPALESNIENIKQLFLDAMQTIIEKMAGKA